MAKEKLSIEQLEAKKTQLEMEIKSLEEVIKASNTSVFDLLINEVKKEMECNIAEEEWKKLKENQKKVESYRAIEKALQNQEDLLDKKQDELEDVEYELTHYQKGLFDQDQEQEETEEETEQAEPEPESEERTGYFNDSTNEEIFTGDVFFKENHKNNDGSFSNGYYIIFKSKELEGSYAILSNDFEGERLMQYPSNLKILEGTEYVGNVFIFDENHDQAMTIAKIIADSTKN